MNWKFWKRAAGAPQEPEMTALERAILDDLKYTPEKWTLERDSTGGAIKATNRSKESIVTIRACDIGVALVSGVPLSLPFARAWYAQADETLRARECEELVKHREKIVSDLTKMFEV